MAGGIDWYRAHHGTVEDSKLGLIAQRSRQRRGDVIAMWHWLLEKASKAEDRGNPGVPDFESIDFLLGMDDGGALAIYQAMADKGMVQNDGRLEAWDRRQPKREREDNTAAERQRAKRERDSVEVTGQVSVTPCHATSRQLEPDEEQSHQKTPREEESREEKNSSSLRSEEAPPRRASRTATLDVAFLVEAGCELQAAEDWLRVRKAKRAPLTLSAWSDLVAEAAKAGIEPSRAVAICATRNWQGFNHSWNWDDRQGRRLPSDGRGPGQGPPNKQEALEQRNRAAAAEWAERKRQEMEIVDETE